jgi:hypothetical protein
VTICLDKPQRIRADGILIACDLLLFKAPLRQLDFMRKQIAPRKLVSQSELGPQGFETLEALTIAFLAVFNLDDKVVVRVALKARETVARDFILEINLGHGRAMVV